MPLLQKLPVRLTNALTYWNLTKSSENWWIHSTTNCITAGFYEGMIKFRSILIIIIPPTQRSILVSLRPSVPPSLRPTSHVRSVAPTVLFGSISYPYISSSNLRRCVTCKVSCKLSKFEFLPIFQICNFDFVLFWLGIWCESLVWVIMWQWGVSQNEGVIVVLVLAKFEHKAHFWIIVA